MLSRASSMFNKVCDRILMDTRHTSLLFAGLFVVWFLVKQSQLINHDTGWYLYAVEAFLNGGKLYQDTFWEVNPPLALYLTIPPVWLAKIFNGSSIDWFISYIFFLLAFSMYLTSHVLLHCNELSRVGRRLVLLGLFFALSITPAGDFGQREHFLMILVFPYIVLSTVRASGGTCSSTVRTVIGILAGLGFSLKPHFLLAPAVIEGYLFFKGHTPSLKFRRETVALIATVVLYGLFVVTVTPDYINTVVPYAMVVYNNAYKNSIFLVLFRAETLQLPIIVFIHYLTRHKQGYKTFSDIFLILALFFYLIYLIQMKGWHYHIYPVSALLLMALIVMLLKPFQSQSTPVSPSGSSTISSSLRFFMLVIIGFMLFLPLRHSGYSNPFMTQAIPIVKQHAEGKSIFIFSSNVWTGFPLVNYANVDWSSRFPTLWLLPGLTQAQHALSYETTSDRKNLLDDIHRFSMDSVITDIIENPPALVIVDDRKNKSYFGKIQFDYLEHFSSDSRFSDFWSKYEKIDEVLEFSIYRSRCSQPCRVP